MRTTVSFFAVLVAVGCHVSSPVFTPAPNDPAYPCHRSDGSSDPNANWCFPVDGTHTCCPERSTCSSLEGQPVCSYQGPEVGPGGLFEVRKPAARTAERP